MVLVDHTHRNDVAGGSFIQASEAGARSSRSAELGSKAAGDFWLILGRDGDTRADKTLILRRAHRWLGISRRASTSLHRILSLSSEMPDLEHKSDMKPRGLG